MKAKFTFSLLFITIIGLAQQTGNMVLVSGTGEPMQVFVNGRLINNRPLNELRIRDLSSSYYDVKVKFKRLHGPIFTADLYVPPLSEIVYEIYPGSRNHRRGEYIIKDVYPIDDELPYFNPAEVFSFGVAVTGDEQNIQTGQINININNSANNTKPGGAVVYVPGYKGEIGCEPPVTPVRYKDMLKAVKKQSFDENKLRVAKQIIKENTCMTVDQLVGILNLLDFERNKLDLAKFAYHYVYDIKNYYKVNNVFDFESSIRKLDAYIKNQG